MTDYKNLSLGEQVKVDMEISNEFKDEMKTNPSNGYTYNERENIFEKVHSGYACCVCFMNYYTCLCGQT